MSEYGTWDWGYYYLRNGKLVDQYGQVAIETETEFANEDDAEKWLRENNQRGNVIGNYNDLLIMRRKNKEKKNG